MRCTCTNVSCELGVLSTESETWSFHEEEVTGKPVACRTVRLKPGASSKTENSGNPKAERKEWPHNLHISPATVPRTDAVFSIVRKNFEREPADPMEDLDVNAAVWGIFPNTTLQAAVHLGQDHEASLRYVKTNLWNSVEQLHDSSR